MEKRTLSRTVKIHECDANGVLRFDLIFDLFQDLADTHAAEMGLGYEYGISRGIGWVGANYAVKVERMPALNESFTLATWPSDKTLITGIREFSAIDEQGKPLFYASSQWALINLATKRPVKIEGNVPAYDVLPERMVETAFANPALPERTDFSAVFPVRWSEIDLNKHVNNTNYPLWASEAVPRDFRAANQNRIIVEHAERICAAWGNSSTQFERRSYKSPQSLRSRESSPASKRLPARHFPSYSRVGTTQSTPPFASTTRFTTSGGWRSMSSASNGTPFSLRKSTVARQCGQMSQ